VIDRMALAVALAGVLAFGGAVQDSSAAGPPAPAGVWLQADPADSLYRAARQALDRRDYTHAAELFARVPSRFPQSAYAGDAYYWNAFALYRIGGTSQLHAALDALAAQRESHPRAATRGDAQALERRIEGELARRGDQDAAIRVARAAEAAVPPPPPVPPVSPVPPVPPSAPAAPAAPGGSRAPGDDRCASDEDDTRLAALSALQQMDDARARPILRRVLARRDAASVCLRRKAAFLIAQESAEGAEAILLDAARNDPDREVREQAVFWLSQVGTDNAVGALDSIVRNSRDEALRERAIFALSQQAGPRAQQAIRRYAEGSDQSPELRAKAIFWIGQSGGPENDAFLRALFGRVTDDTLRNKVLFSIAQGGGAENARFLLSVARDGRQPLELRKQALFWAGQANAPIADLTALYASLTDRALREQLLFVYSQRDEPAAVDRLLDIARHDPDRELRQKALYWLGQSADPRAAQALQDIIEEP
jgi:HEAT repeat protein